MSTRPTTNAPDAQCYYELVRLAMEQKESLNQLEKKFSTEKTVIETTRQENQLLKKEFTILNKKYVTLEEIYLKSIKKNKKITNALSLTVTTLNKNLKSTQSLVETQNKALRELSTQFHNHPTHTNNHSSSTQSSRTAGLFTKEHFYPSEHSELPINNRSSSTQSSRMAGLFTKEHFYPSEHSELPINNRSSSTQSSRMAGLFTKEHFYPSEHSELPINNRSSSTQSSRTAGLFTEGHLGEHYKRSREEHSKAYRNVVPKHQGDDHPAGKQTQNDKT